MDQIFEYLKKYFEYLLKILSRISNISVVKDNSFYFKKSFQ